MPARDPNQPPDPAAVDETISSSVAPRRRARSAPGEILADRYELLDELGRGAFGIVYRARDRVADTLVAIKILTTASARSPETVARLRRELQAAWKVTHPGVVRVHDLIDLGTRLALLMELVDGETLDRRLARTLRLDVAALTSLALDLTRALAAAHRAGVTHRDLKPSNIIMRASTGRPVVTDFGLSLIPNVTGAIDAEASGDDDAHHEPDSVELTRSGGLCGTPRYMAPEQLAGVTEVGPASDVYALGLVLFEAAAGQRPFAESNLTQLKEARRLRLAPPVSSLRSDLPPLLARAIDRCLERDPAARFPSAVELRKALEPLHRDPPLPPRRRRWPLVLALPALALVGVAAWSLLGDRLPARDRRLTISVEPADELGQAVAAMAQDRLRRDRHLRVTPAKDANLYARLRWHRVADGASVDVELGRRASRLQSLGQVQARSLSEAVDAALERISARADAGQPERPPSDEERAAAARVAAPDVDSWRRYDEVITGAFNELIIDVPSLSKRAEALVAQHPGWLHPYAELINIEGGVSPAARATLARARAAPDADPIGRLMVETAGELDRARLDGLIPRLDRAFAAAPDDVLLGWLLYGALHTARRVDEASAVLRLLNRVRPDLQFGSDLQQELRRAGRAAEIPSLLAAWRRAAPDNRQALASQVSVDLDEGRRAEAASHARDLLFLYGPSPQRLLLLCEVLILTGDLREAASIGEQLLRGDEYERAIAWIHLGQIALLQGRLTAALEAWNSGVSASRPFGVQGPFFQTLEETAATAAFLHAEREFEPAATELVALYSQLGDHAQALAWRIELDAHRKKPRCPDLAAELGRLPSGAGRGSSERQVVRAAAAVGCVPCAEAVRLRLAPVEQNVRSLYQLGVCAETEGQLELAADALGRAAPLREIGIHDGDTPSTVSSLLAGYHLARVLDKLGRHDEARDHYRRFLERWQHADRSLPEVDDARRALDH